MSDAVFAAIVHKIRKDKELEFAAFQPQFIVDQVVAACRFLGQPPHFEARFIDYAIDNLRVKRPDAESHSPTALCEKIG